MDVLKVSKKDFSVGALVPNLSTKIWTERFQTAGDFEFHTTKVEKIGNMLPELSLITLRDTDELFIVEKHTIQQAADGSGADELVITGRSLETFLENRQWHAAQYGKITKMAKNYTIRQAVEVWIWNSIVNDTGNDVVVTTASNAVADVLPNVVVSDTVPSASDGASGPRRVQNGDVYSQMQAFLSAGKLGIRVMRPNGKKGKRVDPGSDGTYNTTPIDPFLKARFDVYQGRDKTGTVTFSFKNGDLVAPSYVFDSTTFKTGVFVDGDPRTHYVTDPDALGGSNTGWNKRDGYLDGGSKDTGTTADDFESGLTDKGLRYLRHDGKHISLISTQISPFTKYKYGRDYRLGDRVHVQGRYGVEQNMWVTEYIRSEDTTNGEIAYPTLSTTPS